MNGFLRRHKQFKLQNTIITDITRKNTCTQKKLQPFYNLYKTLYDDANYDHRLVFNADETSVNFTDGFHCKSVVKDGQPSISGCPDHTPSITLLFFIGTHGTPLTTSLIWPQSSVPDELQELSAYNIRVFANDSGWMTRSTFEFLMLTVYIAQLVERRRNLLAVNKKILLLLDGHSSRISLPVILACIRENITILILPAHSSSITQPNDRGVNSTFKTWFSKLALTHINRIKDLQEVQRDSKAVDPPKPTDSEEADFPPCPNLYPSQ